MKMMNVAACVLLSLFCVAALSAAASQTGSTPSRMPIDRRSLPTKTVKISEEGLVQSESRVDQAWTYLYPRITGQAGYPGTMRCCLPVRTAALFFSP